MNPQILIVDDEPAIVEVLADVFTFNHFDVLTARDGLHALELLKTNTPDIILSDLRMPNCDGQTLFEKVRALPLTSGIPFIFLTATPESLLNLDANAILKKPVQLEILLEEVIKTVRQTDRH